MDICKISMVARRGGNPDIVIEAGGLRITLPRLNQEQRYKLGSLVYGGTLRLVMPCDIETRIEKNEHN